MKIKLFLLSLVLGFTSVAQIAKFDKSVMLVSFNPDMFNNEGAKAMLEQSKMSYDEMVAFFNKELVSNLATDLSDTVNTYPLSAAMTTNTTEDLYDIWACMGYMLSPIPKDQKRNVDPSSNLIGKNPPKDKNGEVATEINSIKGNFLDSKINDKKTFAAICRRLKMQYIVIINELDIKEDYSNPYAVGKNDYTRQIQVHFTLFNNKGVSLAGNVATVDFSSKENDIKKITASYFPIAAEKIKNFLLPYINK